jgi:hypothetical protein
VSTTPAEGSVPEVGEPIQLPGHGLVEATEPLARELTDLIREVDRINIMNPFQALMLFRRFQAKQVELDPRVTKKLSEALGALRSPVSNAPPLLAGLFQAWSVGQALTATLLLQMQWQRLTSSGSFHS